MTKILAAACCLTLASCGLTHDDIDTAIDALGMASSVLDQAGHDWVTFMEGRGPR